MDPGDWIQSCKPYKATSESLRKSPLGTLTKRAFSFMKERSGGHQSHIQASREVTFICN
jgi:hypothetical protein